MTDNTEAESLWADTTGGVAWRCYPTCDYTEAQARSAYRARVEAEPRYTVCHDGMWWCGPVEALP
jgi:hypothetical protein